MLVTTSEMNGGVTVSHVGQKSRRKEFLLVFCLQILAENVGSLEFVDGTEPGR